MKKYIRQVLVSFSFIIVVSILWNTSIFFQLFKKEERVKMEIWAEALGEFLQTTDLDRDLNLTLAVIKNNTTTPIIYIGKKGEIRSNNLPEEKVKGDTVFRQRKIAQFKSENPPIEVVFEQDVFGTLYYGNSTVLNNLKYYPVALILIIVLFGTVVYFYYRTSKVANQNKLWIGMAKETAHQIGTPLSSLLGWTELLKSENVSAEITKEIEKDIDKLAVITDRFSKIGSIPKLEKTALIEETIKTFNYLKLRNQQHVQFEFITELPEVFVQLNKQLYAWTIENLIVNSIDAMKGEGTLTLEVVQTSQHIKILITDTGKGIHRKFFKKIFEPGFTTKKRGWGLGMSLVKRIIEDYHNGSVKVLSSTVGRGTTIQILLKTCTLE